MDNKLPRRKPLRLKDFDYNSAGPYFITVCTHNKKNTLSRIVGAFDDSPKVDLTPMGRIVDAVINNIPSHIEVEVCRYVIMPNHIHLILGIYESDERACQGVPVRLRSSISKAVGYIKMKSSKEIRNAFGEEVVWQRGYHDHIIRNHRDFEKIAEYIYYNPARWQFDCFYSERDE